MSLVSVSILLAAGGAQETVKRLTAAGLDVQKFFPRFGQVYGVIDESEMDTLRAIDGVTAVRKEDTLNATDDH
jgi:hypothetical protein